MIRNSDFEELDVFVVYARPEPRINESSANLLNGGWIIQTLGKPSEVLKVRVAARWTVIQELIEYAEKKTKLHVTFLDFEKSGIIMGTPSYDLGEPHETNPIYIMNFDMAVIPDV